MGKHADFGPSYSKQAIACPASVTKTRGVRGKASAASREGTAMHTINELVIEGAVPREDFVAGGSISASGQEVEITEDMLDACDTFINFAEMLRMGADIFLVEQRVSIDWLYCPEEPPEACFGTADLITYTAIERILNVVDFKGGKGHVVNPKDNSQGMVYALGALQKIADMGLTMPTHIRIVIVQPRAGGDAIRSHIISLSELMAWHKEVLDPALRRVAAGDETENPGEHCTFCRRAAECRSLHAFATQKSMVLFDDEEPRAPDVADFTTEQLGAILERAEIIEAWIRTVRQTVAERLNEGVEVPGWKLVAKRSIRRWRDPANARAILADTLGPDDLYTPAELRSPAQIEKALKKNGIDPKVIDAMITRESNQTALVREDDPREKVLRLAPDLLFPDDA